MKKILKVLNSVIGRFFIKKETLIIMANLNNREIMILKKENMQGINLRNYMRLLWELIRGPPGIKTISM